MEILKIANSKVRKELLNFYFINSEKQFYLRELERILKFPVANIRRELIKLEKIGLFKSERKGNLLYYPLNTSYQLYKEIKSIVSKTSGLPIILKESLRKAKGIEVALIYGSFAKGEERSSSDIDLFIIGKIDETGLVNTLNRLEKKIQREINSAVYERKDFEKKKKENPFLLDLLKSPKIFIIGDKNGVSAKWKRMG